MIRRWTEAEVRALGVRTDLVTACAVVYGCGRTKAYELMRRGALDFPALHVGQRIVVPVAPLLALLGLTPTNEAGAPTRAPSSTYTDRSPTEAPDVRTIPRTQQRSA